MGMTHEGTRSWVAYVTKKKKKHNRSMGMTTVFFCLNLSSALTSVIYRYTRDALERPPKPEQRQVKNIFFIALLKLTINNVNN